MSRDSSVCSGPTNDVKVVSVSLSFMLRLTKSSVNCLRVKDDAFHMYESASLLMNTDLLLLISSTINLYSVWCSDREWRETFTLTEISSS